MMIPKKKLQIEHDISKTHKMKFNAFYLYEIKMIHYISSQYVRKVKIKNKINYK